MALKRTELLELASTVYDYMVRGKKDTWIMEQLGIDAEDFQEVKRFLLESKAENIRNQPREHYFVEYSIEQRRNIRDLDDLIKNLDKGSQYNAIIGAIRLRSDITDKIVNRAQEFGLVKKEATKHEMVGGIIIAQLGADELRKAITDQTKALGEAMGRYGEKSFLALPATGALHYGPSIDTTGDSAPEPDDSHLLDDDDEKPKPTTARSLRAAAREASRKAAEKLARKRAAVGTRFDR
jgi:hypothetical protein